MNIQISTPLPIRKLAQNVIDKIAAGESISSPYNAVKELLENSIDSNATNISITIANGGLSLIEIVDNGVGIPNNDLPKSCLRHYTSKISMFDDLSSLSTLGFRGEALASICAISQRVTISSRTKDSKLAYSVSFINGDMASSVTPGPGEIGTSIAVYSLFSNSPLKASTFHIKKSTRSIEHLVFSYSILYPTVSFSLYSKVKENIVPLLSLSSCEDISARLSSHFAVKTSSIIICQHPTKSPDLMNPINMNFAHESPFIPENSQNAEDVQDFQEIPNLCSAKIVSFSQVTHDPSLSYYQPIIFVNNRLVSNQSISIKLKNVYKSVFPHSHRPFISLFLDIQPETIDVNIHPSKDTVSFLYMKEIFNLISLLFHSNLLHYQTTAFQTLKTEPPPVPLDFSLAQISENSLSDHPTDSLTSSSPFRSVLSQNRKLLKSTSIPTPQPSRQEEISTPPTITDTLKNSRNPLVSTLPNYPKISDLPCIGPLSINGSLNPDSRSSSTPHDQDNNFPLISSSVDLVSRKRHKPLSNSNVPARLKVRVDPRQQTLTSFMPIIGSRTKLISKSSSSSNIPDSPNSDESPSNLSNSPHIPDTPANNCSDCCRVFGRHSSMLFCCCKDCSHFSENFDVVLKPLFLI